MRPIQSLAFAAVVLLLAGVVVAEDEIIYFTNGTTMAVESHSIEEDTVRVDLGGQAIMEFPLEQIEKIETAAGEVPIPPPGANRMVSRPGTKAEIVTGSVPSRMRRGQWRDRNPRSGAEDAAVGRGRSVGYHPFGPNASKSKQGIVVTGRQRPSEAASNGNLSGGLVGTTRIGKRYTLPPGQDGGVRRQPSGVMARGEGSPPPKPKAEND